MSPGAAVCRDRVLSGHTAHFASATIQPYPRAMKWVPTDWSAAANAADVGMRVPRGLMSFATDTRGQPPREQRTLYLGAIAFAYAVWENFVEDLAIELIKVLADEISPDRVSKGSQKLILDGATAWEISVHPGWQGLWVDRVISLTKGNPETLVWGLNTASVKKSLRSLRHLGSRRAPFLGAYPFQLRAMAGNRGRRPKFPPTLPERFT